MSAKPGPRILLVSHSARRIAGVETYLSDLLRELERRGIPAALLAASDEPEDRERIAANPGTPVFARIEEALAWKPDLAMCHGRIPPGWEDDILARLPSAYFIHNYHGTCISGLKRHTIPRPEPCFRRLGPACLALYLPRGCGGKNPVTMFQLYGQESAHQKRLKRYGLLVTHSSAMRDEYVRHGFAEEKIEVIPFACIPDEFPTKRPDLEAAALGPVIRILFAGRMEEAKGGHVLLRAAALWAISQERSVQLTMAGHGPARNDWERLAKTLTASSPRLDVAFPGWLDGRAMTGEFERQHLFAMPSLWPEPFGKGGIEAAQYGCPSAGFRLGGIPDWLIDGANGHLADWQGDPVRNLAEAIGKTFQSERHYTSLRRGASERAAEFTSSAHVERLLPLFRKLASGA